MSGEVLIDLICIAVRQETPEAKSYLFRRRNALRPDFEPGQFLTLAFQIDGEEHLRAYSISSSAFAQDWLSITVKRIAGGKVSHWLYNHMKPGIEVKAKAPAGMFSFGAEPDGPILLLTAGSGITPAASMLRTLAHRASDADLVLVHFASSPEDMIFGSEMRQWARTLPNLRVIPVITRPAPYAGWVGAVGRLSTSLIEGVVPDVAMRAVYCCGPAAFMEGAGKILYGLGVPTDRFRTESFDSVDDAAEEPAPLAGGTRYVVQFAKSGQSATVGAGTTVLKAAKDAKVRIQMSCGKGVCGTCRIKLLSGTVDIDHQGGIKQREIDQGFILACCSRPTSNVLVEK